MREKLFELMLRFYPSSFRHEFGEEMRATFRERSGDGSGALTREIVSLPASLLAAWANDDAPLEDAWTPAAGRAQGIAVTLVVLATIIGSASFAAHMLTTVGLYHLSSVALLIAGFLAASLLIGFGAGSESRLRRQQLAIVGSALLVAAIAISSMSDLYFATRQREGAPHALVLPGVQLHTMRSSDAAAVRQLEKNLKDDSARFRVDVRTADGQHLVRILRSGNVDGLYIAALLILIGATVSITAHGTRRLKAA